MVCVDVLLLWWMVVNCVVVVVLGVFDGVMVVVKCVVVYLVLKWLVKCVWW